MLIKSYVLIVIKKAIMLIIALSQKTNIGLNNFYAID